MTYGALVVQLIQDYEDYAEVNKQLEKMGYNIGTRLIEDFLARSNLGRCTDFRETGEVISKVQHYFHPTYSLPLSLYMYVTRRMIGRLQIIFERYADGRALAAATSARPIALEHPCRTTTASSFTAAILYSHLGREPLGRVRGTPGRGDRRRVVV